MTCAYSVPSNPLYAQTRKVSEAGLPTYAEAVAVSEFGLHELADDAFTQ